ncbi:MAG: CDP-diglyceride synthetase, partial [Acidobacteria bacterium]|nr:CDP-diglyceride synthetase [Acidobacteriota bacterium]
MTDPATATVPPPPRRFTRELTTLVAAPVAIWIIGWSPTVVFDAALALVGCLALYEFLILGRKKGFVIPIPLCLLVMLFIIAAFVFEPVSVEMGVFLALLLIPGSYVITSSDLDNALPSSAIAVLATLYVGMLGGSLIRLRNDFPVDGPHLVFFLLIVVWIGDAGAYYIGKRFGRHKLSPRISPKKTIEGGAGGVATSVIAAVVIHYTFFPNFPLLHAIIAGILLSICGVIGDLAESM